MLAAAGVGRSQLAGGVLASRPATPIYLVGRCLPYGRGITFWALGEIVRQAAGVTEDDAPAAGLDRIPSVSGGVEIAERVAPAVGLVERSFPLEEIVLAARRFFESIARTQPVV